MIDFLVRPTDGMHLVNILYLVTLMFGLCVTYFFFYFGIPWFFNTRPRRFGIRSLYALGAILISFLIIEYISFGICGAFWGNRVQHALGGGFLISYICFRALRDAGQRMDPMRFIILAGLLATALGVANEIAEFFLQLYTQAIFSDSALDTWYDLLSNTVGILCSAPLLALFLRGKSTSNF